MSKQFEHTVVSLLHGMETRLDGMQAQLNSHGEKFELIFDILARQHTTLQEYSGLLTQVAERLDGHDRMFEQIIQRLDEHDGRLDRHDAGLNHVIKQLGDHDDKFQQIIDGVIPEMEKRVAQEETLQRHERRLRALESHS